MTATANISAETFSTINDMLDAVVLDWLHAGGFNDEGQIAEILCQHTPAELTEEMCSAIGLVIRKDKTIRQTKGGALLEPGEYLAEEFEQAFARAVGKFNKA